MDLQMDLAHPCTNGQDSLVFLYSSAQGPLQLLTIKDQRGQRPVELLGFGRETVCYVRYASS